ncbi:MAG: DUF4390 domain-containing protein [Deferrisomatales bacterium]
MGIRRTLILLVLCCLVASPASSRSPRGAAYIDSVHLRRGARGDLVLDFQVQNALDARVLDTLDSGLPVRFTYWIRVERPRELARDEVVSDLRLERVLEKDNLKDRYRVTLGASATPRDVGVLSEAIAVMSRVEGVSLMPLEALGGRRPAVLRIKAQLQKFQLPFRLHYVFAFVSYLDVETDWYVVELPRQPDALP